MRNWICIILGFGLGVNWEFKSLSNFLEKVFLDKCVFEILFDKYIFLENDEFVENYEDKNYERFIKNKNKFKSIWVGLIIFDGWNVKI